MYITATLKDHANHHSECKTLKRNVACGLDGRVWGAHRLCLLLFYCFCDPSPPCELRCFGSFDRISFVFHRLAMGLRQ